MPAVRGCCLSVVWLPGLSGSEARSGQGCPRSGDAILRMCGCQGLKSVAEVEKCPQALVLTQQSVPERTSRFQAGSAVPVCAAVSSRIFRGSPLLGSRTSERAPAPHSE